MAISDEQFHEFHLDGKQMFFLFMASLVVGVVIFLCGVMVGRGVRAPRLGEPTDVLAATILDPTAPSEPHGGSDVTIREKNGATPPVEDLTYTKRLESPSPAPDVLREKPETLRKQPDTLREPAPPEPPAAAAPPAGIAPPLEPPGNGFVVQVMSVTQRAEAETVARRLLSKGYPAFVSPTSEGGQRFRVRVGKYPDRREAQSVAKRLEKEEKFKKPWVAR